MARGTPVNVSQLVSLLCSKPSRAPSLSHRKSQGLPQQPASTSQTSSCPSLPQAPHSSLNRSRWSCLKAFAPCSPPHLVVLSSDICVAGSPPSFRSLLQGHFSVPSDPPLPSTLHALYPAFLSSPARTIQLPHTRMRLSGSCHLPTRT